MWIPLGIFIFLLIVDRIAMFHKRTNGITIHDPMLALDPEFIEDLAVAIHDASRRSLKRQVQGLGQ